MKKFATLFLCGLLYAASANAETLQWDCGRGNITDVTATLENGVLTISGSGMGAMDDFFANNYAPWYAYREEITTLIIESGVTRIGIYAFLECSGITTVSIPDGVTYISKSAFEQSGLTTVSIPDGVTTIDDRAFGSCPLAAVINLCTSLPTLGTNVFDGVDMTTCRLYVPTTAADNYQDDSMWGDFDIQPVDESCELASLSVSAGTLSPAFHPNITAYTCTVFYSDITFTITAAALHDQATVVGAGTKTLSMGSNTLSIVVTAQDGATSSTYTLTVTVIQPVTSVTLNKLVDTLAVGKTEKLTATVEPSNATNQAIIWSSDNDDIATVNSTGLVTAVSVGTTNIIATTEDGGHTVQCTVTVIQPVTGVTLNKSLTTIVAESTEQLTATVEPSNATNQNVIWSSSDDEIATVSSTGEVTAVSEGTTTITVTTEDGGHTAACIVRVTATPLTLYEVTFYSSDEVVFTTQTVAEDETAAEPTSKPTRIHHIFGGWYADTTDWNAEGWSFDTPITQDTSLYAKWILSHTVTFNSRGGSSIPQQEVEHGKTATAPSPAPTRTGHTFDKWYRDSTCTNAWNFATSLVTQDTTLYAKWIINSYTITFNPLGGSSVPSQSVLYGSLATEPAPPTRTGYTFDGWYKETECANVWDFDTDTVKGNTTLYAHWTPVKCVVTYKPNYGANANHFVDTVPYDARATEPAPPTRPSYTFGGWYREAACIVKWDFTTDTVRGNTTLYAKWTLTTYALVTFNSMGGTAVAPKTVPVGEKVAKPQNPIYSKDSSNTFIGWYKEAKCVNEWNFDTDIVTGNLTLYAKWTLPTAAAAHRTSPLKAWSHNGVLHIKGLLVGQAYRIYSISGSLVHQGVAADEQVSIALGAPAGIYVVVQGKGSVKAALK